MNRATLVLALLASTGALAQGKGRHEAAAPTAEKKPAAPAPAAEAPAPAMVPRGPTRIDFDDRLVQGQTNKLGAVYLYQRKAPQQQSLLHRRQTFRDEIARDLLE